MKKTPKFKIRNKSHFVLVAPNGKVILTSETYKTIDSVRRGIRAVKKVAKNSDNYKKLVAKDGSPYFVLMAKNNRVVGTSEMYNTRFSRWIGIQSVIRNASKAQIVYV
jgi:uncharacterized protein YegP (UPF0339 family)